MLKKMHEILDAIWMDFVKECALDCAFGEADFNGFVEFETYPERDLNEIVVRANLESMCCAPVEEFGIYCYPRKEGGWYIEMAYMFDGDYLETDTGESRLIHTLEGEITRGSVLAKLRSMKKELGGLEAADTEEDWD